MANGSSMASVKNTVEIFKVIRWIRFKILETADGIL